nr:MAG TPA: hypothetical protein [Caudoviricetes sp.]
MKYDFVILLFDDYMMSQTSCNPKTMSIKPLRVTSSFMVNLSLHNESSILLLHKISHSKTNRTTKRA